MQCHGEKGVFYLGVFTGIRRSKSHTDVTSNITCGHCTILHAWTITFLGKMPQRKDVQSYTEQYLKTPQY